MGASANINCGDDQFCTNASWNIDPDRNRNGPIDPSTPLKDTVLIPSGGYAVVYFTSNNPGYWFLHCHIEVHQLEGMAVVINEAPGQHNGPPPNMGECGPFTWDVEMFKNKVSSPGPNRQRPTIYVGEYDDLYTHYVVSAVFAGIFGGILLLLIGIAIYVFVVKVRE